MYIYRSRFLKRGEVWFDDEPDNTPVDWIYYRQRPAPIPGGRWNYFYTVLIDLAKDRAQLLAEMDENAVRKIESAQKSDGVRWECCDASDAKVMDAVERMWNQSALFRKSAPLGRPWLDRLIEAGALHLSATRDATGSVLTYHVTYVGKKRAQDLIAVSSHDAVPNPAMRAKVNRANSLGHWQIMLAMQARGLRHYDFGGWYAGTTDIRFLGMNAFKEGFGGEIVREFECGEIRTLKGWLVLASARLLNRIEFFNRFKNNGADKTSASEHAAFHKAQTAAHRRDKPTYDHEINATGI